jgi:hypothetical protein
MPGWYIHLETATMVAKRLQAADLPPDATITPLDAQALGDLAHTWRNYLAAGAIGPDIFFLLPDFKGDKGNVLLSVSNWVLSVWDVLDSEFVSKWEKWAQPAIDGVGDVLNQATGGVLAELGQALQEISSAIMDAVLELVTQLYDWFGLLTSGVPQGFADSAFFWSDIFHYRKTFAFAKALYDNAATPQQKAFAIGWMSHLATDVTGHSFVNSKSGGPYRLHWQRHHLVENHMDAKAYSAQHGTEPYGELDTSALHFRLAFRKGLQAPYVGATDAPAYDYFTGFPAYNTDDSAAGAKQRHDFFDLDSGDLPDDLCELIISTMEQVYGPGGPHILDWDPAQFSDLDAAGNPTGRPSVLALQNTYKLLYLYVKKTSTGGYSPRKPTAPPVFNDHSPPAPPGSSSGVNDDPSRGGDPDDDDWNFLDLLLALFGFLVWLAELGVWLATLPAALLADLATYPLRDLLYEYAVLPLWSLYIAARKPLVMQGFLVPKAEEIMQGLVELGVSPEGPLTSLAAALASPDGTGSAPLPFDERSGGMDPAYPRAIVTDPQSLSEQVLGQVLPDPSCGQSEAPSEYLRPWKYPEHDNGGDTVGWEAGLTASGPWRQGQDARVLMGHAPGDPGTRKDYEAAVTPEATDQTSAVRLPAGQHLGDPVEYGTYVVSRLTSGGAGEPMPDFNLDADRGYGYHCWDFNRSGDITVPKVTPDKAFDESHYKFATPCTVPEGYCDDSEFAWSGPGQHFHPEYHLAVHYLGEGTPGDPGCDATVKVTPEDVKEAGGLPPDGRRG